MAEWKEIFKALEDLYREVGDETEKLEKHHSERLNCGRGCCDCCVDNLTVFEVEAEHIRQLGGDVLTQQAPHPKGKCAFLDAEGACRIYAFRPYVCRTQGLPLRWFDVDEDGKTVELRDICPLNEEGDPLEILPADTCWEIGPFEGRLAALQARVDGGQLRRVGLRDLFDAQEEACDAGG